MRAPNKCPLDSMDIQFLKNEVLKDLHKDISRHDIENLRTDLEYIEGFTKDLKTYIVAETVVNAFEDFDPYGFDDCYDSKEEAIEDVLETINKGEIEDLISQLEEIKDNGSQKADYAIELLRSEEK